MYDKVVALISKPIHLRADFEIKGLVPWFKKKSTLMKSLGNDIVAEVIRNCDYARKERDDLIIRQGDQGDCFYIIINGKISIYIDYNMKKDSETKEEEDGSKAATKPPSKAGKPSSGKQRPPAATPIVFSDDEAEKPIDRDSLGTFVTSLGQGIPFGEVALVSDDCVRTASIISDAQTDLMVINRSLYTRCVKEVVAKEFEEKNRFIARNKFFSKWNQKYKKQLAMALYKETYAYDSYLTRQGEPANIIYFVLSGEIKLKMDTSTHHAQYPRIFNCYYKGLQMRLDREKYADEKEFENHDKKRPSEERKRKAGAKVDVCLLGSNGVIGNIEMLLDMQTYAQTAVCTKTTEVLVLELKHYERLLAKRNPRTCDEMRHDVRERLRLRVKHAHMAEAKVPLFRALLHYMENPLNVREMTIQEIIRSESPTYRQMTSRSRSPSPGSPTTGRRGNVVARLYPKPVKNFLEDDEDNFSDVSSDEEFDEFFDEATSDKSLDSLEKRLRTFMSNFDDTRLRSADRVLKLRRLKALPSLPKRGARVMVKSVSRPPQTALQAFPDLLEASHVDLPYAPKAGARVYIHPRSPRPLQTAASPAPAVGQAVGGDSFLTPRERQMQLAMLNIQRSGRYLPRPESVYSDEDSRSVFSMPQA